MRMIGHNKGPSMEPGAGFRKVAWTKARAALLPNLPLEIVRLRVQRAERLGLPYKTYATIRAVSGHDIVAFLFSGNALGVPPAAPVMAEAAAQTLARLDGEAKRLGAIYAPLSPDRMAAAHPALLEAACAAPTLAEPWGQVRARLRAAARAASVPHDGMVVVATHGLERAWADTAGFAGTVASAEIIRPG